MGVKGTLCASIRGTGRLGTGAGERIAAGLRALLRDADRVLVLEAGDVVADVLAASIPSQAWSSYGRQSLVTEPVSSVGELLAALLTHTGLLGRDITPLFIP